MYYTAVCKVMYIPVKIKIDSSFDFGEIETGGLWMVDLRCQVDVIVLIY